MIDVTEILVHWYAGRPKTEVAASLGVDPKTVRKYVAPAEAAGFCPGGPAVRSGEWERRVREWFPELVDTRLRQVSWPTIEAHRDYIVDQLGRRVTVATAHQRLRDEHGLEASVASVRRWVRANLPEEARRDQVRVGEPEAGAAEQRAGEREGHHSWASPACWDAFTSPP